MDITEKQAACRAKWLSLLGGLPSARPAPDAKVLLEEQGDGYRKIKVSLAGDLEYADDRITAWLLLPDGASGPLPLMMALHPTTGGCGKDIVIGEPTRTVPLAGTNLHMTSEMIANRGYGQFFVRAGYAVFAPDLYSDGERVEAGHTLYDISRFYERYPDWSAAGKGVYDNMIALDWLTTLPEIDASRIGIVGHSLGGHGAVFTASLDERITACCSNGGVTVFGKALGHWARLPLPPDSNLPKNYSFCYIPNFRNYMAHIEVPNPLEFGDVMGLIAPRPLLYGGCIYNEGTPGYVEISQETWDTAQEYYTLAGVPDALEYNIYPGGHDFPPKARHDTLAWFNRVLKCSLSNITH